MQIHVVRPGESVSSIARAYGVTAARIVAANGIRGQRGLAVGEALVIPITGSFYTVRPGDTIFLIARRYGLAPRELARVNRINPAMLLRVGQRLYIPPRARRPVEANAYAEPTGGRVSENLRSSVEETARSLTYVAPFSYRMKRDGSLEAPPLDNIPALARQGGATLMMAVTNIEGDTFSAEVAEAVLGSEAVQDRLLANIIRIAGEVGYSDVHFDMEFLRPEDREPYNRFLRRAAERIHGAGLLMSTALAPKISATQRGQWYEAHDYRTHGQVADFVVIMTYEWGYSGGPPQAVSPIGPVRQVLEYAMSEMPASKIMMGQNLYGYDWTLPYVRGGPFARVVSPQEAVELAVREGVPIQYDERAQAPFFRYTDDAGKTHEVWFEDARSIQAKFDLIRELGLRGISYWKLGIAFPQNWVLLNDNFNVTKRARRG
ncbi:MAG TPA: glycoside hydrolase family 18 protein [Symbiobacteriaceae bacterium]|nr:glycoside hydrolase family 18 protein [Symbiobacteriaceae bacterium]